MEEIELKRILDEFSDNLSDLLSIERDKTGKRDAEIAKEMGVEKASISKYKNGQQEIRASNLVRIANYFGVSTDYLLGIKKKESEAENVSVASKATGLPRQAIRAIANLDENQTTALAVLLQQPEFGALLSKLYSAASGKATCDYLETAIQQEQQHDMKTVQIFALESAEPKYRFEVRTLSNIPATLFNNVIGALSEKDIVREDGIRTAQKEILDMRRTFSNRQREEKLNGQH